MVVTLAVTLQNTVLSAGRHLTAASREWTAELFLREQIANLDRTLTERFVQDTPDERSLIFVSRRSGMFGREGPPVLIRLRFGPDRRRLEMQEALLPPWWCKKEDSDLFVDFGRLYRNSRYRWSNGVFVDLDGGSLSYWDPKYESWVSQWPSPAHTLKAVRVTLTTLFFSRDIVVTIGASSYFSSSGS